MAKRSLLSRCPSYITVISKKSQILKSNTGTEKGDTKMSVIYDLKGAFGHENLLISKWYNAGLSNVQRI